MAALSKQRGVELMRWERGTMHERVVRAYFMSGKVLQKDAGHGWRLGGHWSIVDLAEVKAGLAECGWKQSHSMGKKV